jgi:hypothetical protein
MGRERPLRQGPEESSGADKKCFQEVLIPGSVDQKCRCLTRAGSFQLDFNDGAADWRFLVEQR